MSYITIQSVAAVSSLGVTTLAVSVASTLGGSLLTLAFGIGSVSGAITVTDNIGNTWTQRQAVSSLGYLYDCYNATAGVTTVTINWTTSTSCAAVFKEFSGVTSGFDVGTTSSGTGTMASSGTSATTTGATDLVLGWCATTAAGTPIGAGGSFGDFKSASGPGFASAQEDLQASGTGTESASFPLNSSAVWQCGVATYGSVNTAGTQSKPNISCLPFQWQNFSYCIRALGNIVNGLRTSFYRRLKIGSTSILS